MSYYASEVERGYDTRYVPTRLGPLMNSRTSLHELYPGRLLSTRDHYSGDTTPNENPEKLQQHRDIHSALYRASAAREEALSRHLGGKGPKVLPQPPVEPDSFAENPALRNVHISHGAEDNAVVGSTEFTGDPILENFMNSGKGCVGCNDDSGLIESYGKAKGVRGWLNSNYAIGCSIAIVSLLIAILIWMRDGWMAGFC